jgi:ubiquitin-like protein Pup
MTQNSRERAANKPEDAQAEIDAAEAAEEQVRTAKAKQDAVEAAGDAALAGVGDIDALLDEIDGVLEVNAQEVVDGYVQRGGQ